jgi:Tfp pilus assembly protein PilX
MRRRCAPARSQRGVVVFIALIVLVAMMLAGVATMRASGGAILTAGNLGFRQNATVAGDLGLEAARAWLTSPGVGPATLETTNAAKGYYATWNEQLPALPPGGVWDPVLWGESNWRDNTKAVQVNPTTPDAAGNTVSYVIHRMCRDPGSVSLADQECVLVSDPGKGGPKEAGQKVITGTSKVYFRVTARIEGPKRTVSYVQAMMY